MPNEITEVTRRAIFDFLTASDLTPENWSTPTCTDGRRIRPQGGSDEEESVHRGADHRRSEGTESGADVGQLCRRVGISRVTPYAWKKKYGGMDVSEAKRLRKLEDENGQQNLRVRTTLA
jgi:hypothetical protein